jgi:hypothetical protein
MTDRRQKLLKHLSKANPTESEQRMTQLVIERICSDMCDFYDKFYAQEGPGAIIYVPRADNDEDTMFYLTVPALMTALKDFRNHDMEGPADVMQKAIARAESLDIQKEALFVLQDDQYMSLIHYKRELSAQPFLD